ncbi:MAG: dynamin family protein [Alphaproteobacteria bacterium]|nr:dynamin family protein [Alphaproteobacteria bacterium]
MTEAMQILYGLIADARSQLKRVEAPGHVDVRNTLDATLDRLQRSLHRSPVVLIAGETNSGKTSVANMLAGLDVLPSAVIGNTAVPVRLKHGVVPSVTAVTGTGRLPLATLAGNEPLPRFLYSGLERIDVDLPSMRNVDFEILDTPGCHGSVPFQEEADIFLWCSVAARPWTDSERRAVSGLPARLRERSLLVVTHKDTLSPADRDRVLRRYEEIAGQYFADIVMIDAAARSFAANGSTGRPGAVRIGDGDGAELISSLNELVEEFWDHRSVTGRRLCRHIARALKPFLPVPAINGGVPSRADPFEVLLANLAGRLANV